MKKNVFTFIIFSFILLGCNKESVNEPMFLLEEFCSTYLGTTNVYLPGFSYYSLNHQCLIEYRNGRLSRVIHKKAIPIPMNPDGSFNIPKDYYEEFTYKENIITSTKKSDESNFKTEVLAEYTIGKNNQIIKKISFADKDTTYYTYSENGLLKKSITYMYGNSTLNRKFIFDSRNNLIEIISKKEENGNFKYSCYEYFEDYDTTINGFKNIGLIEGAFIRSLSENNFKSYTYKVYSNSITIINASNITLSIQYDEKNHPIYGRCDF